MKEKEVKLSLEFRKQTTNAIISIIVFIISYLILLAFAIGITILCLYGGISIIAAKPMIFTFLIGGGIASMGILIFIFLVKFVFSFHKKDRTGLKEITRNEQPELFQMIDEIVDEVGTNFPKKVYLSPEVNASVFYDSSFWSMFFPVQKNLNIGLGLINTCTKDELKSILAHEFGHFSQKTMKIGSYVYHVNHVIYNMLNDDEFFDKTMQGVANISQIVSLFVLITAYIVLGIRWILIQLYHIVNKNHLALSREMEFHADEIAASITGSKPLQTSLLRMSLCDYALNEVYHFYNDFYDENIKSHNFYKDQFYVMNFLAKNNKIKIKENYPQVSLDYLNKFNKSKLVIKDQWASHPSTEDRVEKLENLNYKTTSSTIESANSIFKDIEKIQEEFTFNFFKQIEYKGETSTISFQEFERKYVENHLKNTFSDLYNEYYNTKNPVIFDINESSSKDVNFDEKILFSDEIKNRVYTLLAYNRDLETLKLIESKEISIKTFDYDGRKYHSKDASSLISKIKKEKEKLDRIIEENDQNIFYFFLKLEQKQDKNKLKELYQKLFDIDKEFDEKEELYQKMMQKLEFLHESSMTIEDAKRNFSNLFSFEKKLKETAKSYLEDEALKEEFIIAVKENMEAYLTKDWEYVGKQSLFEKNITMLFNVISDCSYLNSRRYFYTKKELLVYQEKLIKNQKESLEQIKVLKQE
ncbi:M48 family metallopeptidase [Aureivirga marina]|uniref:M48 family metallopeptidase n=1 Tax=Aureivirga marina TaxID=1182451 RepID=UPI0018CBD496|nr:M48 family metallopeptidase [Aureivirga marina]